MAKRKRKSIDGPLPDVRDFDELVPDGPEHRFLVIHNYYGGRPEREPMWISQQHLRLTREEAVFDRENMDSARRQTAFVARIKMPRPTP